MASSTEMNGLELDRRDDSAIALSKPEEREEYAYSHQPSGARTLPTPVALKPGLPSKRFSGLRPTTLVLSVALAVVTLLAVVAAALGGSLAAKRGHWYVTIFIC